MRNSVCRGKIRRYTEEHQKRRQHAGKLLTLRDESVGSNGIRYPGSPRRKRWILVVGGLDPFSDDANALSIPPVEYDRKVKT